MELNSRAFLLKVITGKTYRNSYLLRMLRSQGLSRL